MGWAQKLPSGRFRAMYRDYAGKQRGAGTFDTRKVAEAAATRAEGVARNDPEVLSGVTVREWGEEWWPTRMVARATRDVDMLRWNKRVLPRWGDTPLEDVTRGGIEAWASELQSSGLSASTTVKYVMVLSASMSAAVNSGRLRANPCSRVKLPKTGLTPDRFLEDEEVNALTALLEGDDRLMWQLLVGTGLRWGEAAGLHWDHVDLDSRALRVRYSWDRVGKGFKPPKSHAERTVPISKSLSGLLSKRLESVGYGDVPKLPYDGPTPRTGLVLPYSDGGPYSNAVFGRHLAAAGKIAVVGTGITQRRVGHVRPHDARHTFASKLAQQGIDLYVIQKLLGHAHITETERYARLKPGRWDAVRAVLDT